ncbi:MAG: transposase [Bryobacterales bacterium]|nr:transposase [Bryobacterales bacterium]
MARIARVVAVGCPHHVTQRGNFRRDIFFDDQDRQTYLDQLSEAFDDPQLRIWGHCLMSNHVHLIVVPNVRLHGQSFRIAHSNYSRWLNIRLRRCGHVWQNRYFSCPLDPAHAAYAMRYVEFNPVRAGMVESVLDYAWSSAKAHAGLDAAPPWHGSQDWAKRYPPEKWREVLGLGFRLSGDLDRLREATRTGRPFGAPDFVAELEAKLDRVLLPQKRGPKSVAAEQIQTAAGGVPLA